MPLFIGIDGGGTKTTVWAVDTLRRRVGRCSGSAGNPNVVGYERALSVVRDLVARALAAVDRTGGDVNSLSACLSGVEGDRAQMVSRWSADLSGICPGALVAVTNDALAALTAGTEGEPGILLVAGTGSIAVGERADGAVARAGGYGYLLGDEGSGFDIGRRGLVAAIQGAELRGPKTALWERAARRWQAGGPQELIPHVYDAGRPTAVIASFAEDVLDCCAEDAVARRIVDESLEHYAGLIRSVQARLALSEPPPVVLSGGLFTHHPLLLGELEGKMEDFQFRLVQRPPVAGAVLRAMDAWHIHAGRVPGRGRIDESVVEVWRELVGGGDG